MSDGFDIELNGFDELDKQLSKLDKKVQKSVSLKALRAGANVIRDEAKELVPVDSGNLKKSIGVFTARRKTAFREVFIGPRKGKKRKNDGWYGHFIEFGTSKQAPKPFLRPAAKSKASEAIRVLGEKLAEGIIEAVKKG